MGSGFLALKTLSSLVSIGPSEGLFAECLAVALIIFLQVCQSATLRLAAASCK